MENGLCETVGWRAEGKTEKHEEMDMGGETSDCITTACGIFDGLNSDRGNAYAGRQA